MTKVSLSSSAVSAQQRTPIYVANLEVVKSKKKNNKHMQINQGISYQIDPTNYPPPPEKFLLLCMFRKTLSLFKGTFNG